MVNIRIIAILYLSFPSTVLAQADMSINTQRKVADILNMTLSYQNIKESRHTRRFNAAERRNQLEHVDVWSFTADFQRSWNKHKIRYGVDAQFSQVESNAFHVNVFNGEHTPAGTRYPDGGSNMHNYALYFTHRQEFNDALNYTSGARIGVSALNAVFDDKTFFPFPFDEVNQKNRYASGNLGLVFRPDKQWKLSFMGSTGFRVPNIDDLGKVFDTRAGEALIIPNPDIKPEKTINFDFSVSRYFADNIRWENTFFYTLFLDAIVLDASTFMGQPEIYFDGKLTKVLANQNKRRAYMTGFSSVLHGELSNSFLVEAAFTYTRGRIKAHSGQTPLDHIPPPFGRVSLQYHPKKITAEIFANFNLWKRLDDYMLNSEDNEVYATPLGTPAWKTINFRFGYAFTSYFTLQAGVDNAMDLQYRTFSSGINAPGRNIFGAIRISL